MDFMMEHFRFISKSAIAVILSAVTFITAAAQNIKVTGIVTDGAGGGPIPGVTVVIEGTTKGTSTDADGSFTLTADKNATLQFMILGYKTAT